MIDPELEIARSTAAGREMLAVWEAAKRRQTGEDNLAKSIELTEMTRSLRKAGLRAEHPEATDAQIERMFSDELLAIHGYTRAELDEMVGEAT